jgi:cytochrome c5
MFDSRQRTVLPAFTLVLAACGGGQLATQRSADPSPPDTQPVQEAAVDLGNLFTDAQADRGRIVFRETCSECHYTSEVRGDQFMWDWGGRTVEDLYKNLVRTMPDDDPGSLEPQSYIDVVTYILRLNGVPPGTNELTADGPGLKAPIRAPAGP